jgi:hypothetical protein
MKRGARRESTRNIPVGRSPSIGEISVAALEAMLFYLSPALAIEKRPLEPIVATHGAIPRLKTDATRLTFLT